MRMHAALLLGVGLLLAAGDPRDVASKSEMARFQGTWKFISIEVDGKKKPDEDAKKYTAVFKGDQWTVSEGDTIAAQITYRLDPTKKPKTIDLVDNDRKKLIRGIYCLKGDTLKVCDRDSEKGGRPTEFGTKADSRFVQFVLERVKPAGPEDDALKEEMQKLQGTWQFVWMEVNGKAASDDEFGKLRLVLQGNKWTLHAGDKITSQVTFNVDPTKKPKTIDLASLLDHDKRPLVRGIYSLEEDKLTVCDRGIEKGDRPTEFETTPDSGIVLVVMKRVKP